MKRSTAIKILEKTYKVIEENNATFICPTLSKIGVSYEVHIPSETLITELLNCKFSDLTNPWYSNTSQGKEKRLSYLKNRLNHYSKQPLTTSQKIACLLQVKIELKRKCTPFICSKLRNILEKKQFISNLVIVKNSEIVKIIPELLEFKPKKYDFNDIWFPEYDFKSRHKIINKTILRIIKNKILI